MSEILRVISSSPTDYQPVFDTIVRRAGVVCGAVDAILWTVAGDELVIRAHHGPLPGAIGARQPIHGTVAGYAVREARFVHVEDLTEADDFPVGKDFARRRGGRTVLSAPLLREGGAIGAILIRRSEVRPFTDKQIALLQTFADQAVIAIENVRLFKELEARNRDLTETLEQQTATSEILRVISGSPTDVQPVFDAIVTRAVLLCGGVYGAVYRRYGDTVDCVSHYGLAPEAEEFVRRAFPRPVTAGQSRHFQRALVDGAVVSISDIAAERDVSPRTRDFYLRHEGRSVVLVPLVHQGEILGVLGVGHRNVAAFSDKHVELLKTFADQAVIAIENVRLFTELQEKNRALTEAHAQVSEALEQQTATSEILGVISRSPTDVQPVFEAIARSAVRLCDGFFAMVGISDGELLHVRATHNLPEEWARMAQTVYPAQLDGPMTSALVVREQRVIHVLDQQDDPLVTPRGRERARVAGYHTWVGVPMVGASGAAGLIAVSRREKKAFGDRQIALLQTFADQAVIAIENVRLFTELQASNRELTSALDQQTATSDILRVISRSQTDLQPVFDTIVGSATRLLGANTGALTRIAGDQLDLAALTSSDAAGDAVLRARYPRPLDSLDPQAQALRARGPINTADVPTDPRWTEATRATARARNYRSQAVVPLLRHDEAIGTITVTRVEPGGFTNDEIALLQTFADQAVIAIENARLLTELQDRTRELSRSVDQLTALGDVGRAVSSSLDLDTVLSTIVGRAVQLSGADGGTIFEYDEGAEEFSARATLNADAGQSALLRTTRLRRGEGAVGQMAVTREPLQIPDIAAEGAYESRIRGAMLEAGTRAVLAIPLLHEARIVGGLVVTRRAPGAFSAEVVEILRTFATQSALAIQNARLFREIEDKSRQLEVASQHKSEFLANMSHELRTPLNAIIGFSEVLSERMFGDLNEKQEEYLKDIYASGTHLLSLINDILDLSKIEAGRMELELTDFHLPTALDSAITLVRERAGRRNIPLHTSIDNRLGQIQGDERKIRQVVLNLLSNAIKFTPEGGRIEVAAMSKDSFAEVSVNDTGVGIAPEDQERVFEEFRQVGTADKKAEGTGLGLTLCRKFVELHGGKIWVKSQVGAGSTFTFTIPLHGDE